MTPQPTTESQLSIVSAALLAVTDRLAAEFPHLPPEVIYEKVGQAQLVATKRLPDIEKYEATLESEARLHLYLVDRPSAPTTE